MKAKSAIFTSGVILGSFAVAGMAGAISYQTSSRVQFTFEPTLTLELSADDFLIDNLAPGNSDTSNAVTATVSTNSAAGYNLSATVGNATYTSTSLVSTHGNFTMIGASANSLSAGTWGYTLDDGVSYGALDLTTPTYLNRTVDRTGTGATGFAGGNATVVKIGAYADVTQNPGTYRNVVNFTALTNVATYTIGLALGDHAASASFDDLTASKNILEGEVVNISATCDSGHSFNNWSVSPNYGTIADPTSATTTYTAGGGSANITAHCLAD